jgi:hypothetical protein
MKKQTEYLKYAYTSGAVPPKIIVLVGTDSLSYDFSDSTWKSFGSMPAVVYYHGYPNEINGTLYKLSEVGYSDAWALPRGPTFSGLRPLKGA